MPVIPPTQVPVDYDGKRYSGVFSVSGSLMIVRIPGIGSKSIEVADDTDSRSAAHGLMLDLLQNAQQQGLLIS